MPRLFLKDRNGNFFNSEDYIGKQPIEIFFFPKAGELVFLA